MIIRNTVDARRYLLLGLTILGTLVAVVLALYFYQFHATLSLENTVWGQFGDYLGGVMNPILGFFSFIALLLALMVQAAQSETAVAAFAQTQRDSAKAGEDLLRSMELIQSIAHALREQSKAARTTADLLALAHSLVIVSELIKEEEAHRGVVTSNRLIELREQRDQLTSRLLQLTQPLPEKNDY